MGVDIATYRARIGLFGPRLGKADSGSIGISTATLVILIGAVVFIRQLLIMAGVESNPGPPTGMEFTFRYQYLLIEIGTRVLRQLFDHLVKNDFGQYLINNPAADTQLQNLILKKVITTDQQQVLPPIDANPSSTNFDITLLCCLLRNVCGLKLFSNNSWIKPTSTDNSVEANITRLRECRNELYHSGSVFSSAVDLDAKWRTLTKILNDINTVCKVPNLTSLINDAENMDIDEKLKKHYDMVLRVWTLADNSEELIHGQTLLLEGQSTLSKGQSQLKHSQADIIDGQSQIIKSQTQLADSHSKLREGQTLLYDRQSQIINSQTQLSEGQKQVTNVQSQMLHQLKQDMPLLKTGIENLEKGQQQHAERLNEISNRQQMAQIQIDNIDQNLQDSQHRMLIKESELMNHLITIYNKECGTLPVLPLCEGDDDERELLSFYQPPSLCHKPYHESQGKDEYEVLSYKEIFNKDDKHFRKVYITGDAGTGKTSLCKRMVLLWCKAMSGKTVGDKIVQNDIDLMAEFDFVFYVSLGVAKCTDILTIIAEQLFCNVNDDKKNLIELILKTQKCLIIMDALDEFNENGKININRLLSDKCTFMITCRPFVIETNRLSPNDIDRQIEITGINGDSIKSYVNEIVNHMNEATGGNKTADDFVTDAHRANVYAQLHIPILGSHLILLWFNHELTHMSQALIYSHIIDMLLERAETVKHVAFSSSPECDVQFPDSLSELIYLKQNATFLKKVCLLSFNLLFKKDTHLSQLVFTKAQLLTKPYHVTDQEMNYLCKFGILSKSKAIGSLGKREQTIAFLHKSYMEYFAALFVSSFDRNNEFESVVTNWESPKVTLQHDTFFRFYVGLSPAKRIPISGDLNLAIIYQIFRPHTYLATRLYRIESIQDMVKRLFKLTRTSYQINMSCLKIEHFNFVTPIFDNDMLKQLVKLNGSDVKSLFVSDQCTYLDEFDQINKLQILKFHYVSASTITIFTERLMLKNKSSLHTICIYGHWDSQSTKIKQLNCLTSICLCTVTLQHNNYDDLITFLSNNINMENIKLDHVYCTCKAHYRKCSWTLDLANKMKLKYLSLVCVNIVSEHVNLPDLKFLHLIPLDIYAASFYIDLFNAIHSSQITYLDVNGGNMLHENVTETLASTIESLKYIRELRLWSMVIPDDVLLQFHPDVSEIKVYLHEITMSKTWFDTFIDNIPTTTSTIRVILICCQLRIGEGRNCHDMSVHKSVEYMYNHVKNLPNVKITNKETQFRCLETSKDNNILCLLLSSCIND